MELKVFIKKVAANKRMVLAVPLVLGFLAFIITMRLPTTYRASMTLFVKPLPAVSETEEFFTYEGYYVQQRAKDYSDTLVALLRSREMMVKFFDRHEKYEGFKKVVSLSEAVEARRIAPNLVSVSLKSSRADEASSVVEGLVTVVREETSSLQPESDAGISLEPLSDAPLVEEVNYHPILNGLLVALGSLFLVLGYLGFREYLQD